MCFPSPCDLDHYGSLWSNEGKAFFFGQNSNVIFLKYFITLL